MARANSIWLVRGVFQELVAVFTVKHECATFLRVYEPLLGWAKPAEVVQMRDGAEPTEQYYGHNWTIAEFLEDNPPR